MIKIPIWYILPKKYKWIAKDPDGIWFAFQRKPLKAENGYWYDKKALECSGTFTFDRYSDLLLDLNHETVGFPKDELSKREQSK